VPLRGLDDRSSGPLESLLATAATAVATAAILTHTLARSSSLTQLAKEEGMARPERRYGGITFGGIIVIAGILLIFIWSFWIGLVVALVGLVGFGGFARGKWY
jgi:hypothetical protein